MNQPFRILDQWVKEGRLRLSMPEPAASVPPPSPPGVPESAATDGALFDQAMTDVIRLGWSDVPLETKPPVQLRMEDDEADALSALAEFVRGGRVDLERSQEYIERSVHPDGRIYLADLRKGRFAVQAHLDLHGRTPADARVEMEDFLAESRRKAHACVRIVHGRGLHSDKDTPVLKESIPRWLTTRRMSRMVMAFTSARMCDGGGGAVYVLLRVQ